MNHSFHISFYYLFQNGLVSHIPHNSISPASNWAFYGPYVRCSDAALFFFSNRIDKSDLVRLRRRTVVGLSLHRNVERLWKGDSELNAVATFLNQIAKPRLHRGVDIDERLAQPKLHRLSSFKFATKVDEEQAFLTLPDQRPVHALALIPGGVTTAFEFRRLFDASSCPCESPPKEALWACRLKDVVRFVPDRQKRVIHELK